MRAKLVIVLAVGFLEAGARGQDQAAKEREKLQGIWRVAKLDITDDSWRNFFEGSHWVIKGDKLAWMFGEKDQKQRLLGASLKVNPTREPKTIDLTVDFLHPAFEDRGKVLGKTILAVYVLDGDTLTLFTENSDRERPKRFPAKQGKGVMTLKRRKP